MAKHTVHGVVSELNYWDWKLNHMELVSNHGPIVDLMQDENDCLVGMQSEVLEVNITSKTKDGETVLTTLVAR